jgi:hypothetical protein
MYVGEVTVASRVFAVVHFAVLRSSLIQRAIPSATKVLKPSVASFDTDEVELLLAVPNIK